MITEFKVTVTLEDGEFQNAGNHTPYIVDFVLKYDDGSDETTKLRFSIAEIENRTINKDYFSKAIRRQFENLEMRRRRMKIKIKLVGDEVEGGEEIAGSSYTLVYEEGRKANEIASELLENAVDRWLEILIETQQDFKSFYLSVEKVGSGYSKVYAHRYYGCEKEDHKLSAGKTSAEQVAAEERFKQVFMNTLFDMCKGIAKDFGNAK